MRVMVLAKVVEADENAGPPSPEAFAAMDRYTDELVKAGVFVAAAGLQNTANAIRVVSDGATQSISSGPFPETRDLVAGFSIWEVKDMEEALAWAKRAPHVMPGKSEIEIRPFYEAADLAEFMSPDDLAEVRDGERGKLGVA